MKERPILFSAPMVRAILEGKKTQTRRVIKSWWEDRDDDGWPMVNDPEDGQWFRERCPYGQPGDRLWVRETWQYSWAPEDADLKDCYIYKADFPEYKATPWQPSIHMHRAASRITLEIDGVRVERLQDISDADALAEGIRDLGDGIGELDMSYGLQKALFKNLWQSINGEDSWDANPWVWVIEFKKVEAENGK